MIATLVFSTILLVITFGVLQFSRAYYRGTTTTNLQNTARSVMDTVSQAIQFSGAEISSSPLSTTINANDTGAFCIGGTQFDFILHSKRTNSGAADHVLYRTPRDSGGACTHKAFDPNTSKDLVDAEMRLVNFDISQFSGGINSLWQVELRLAYGDDDLLCSPSLSSSDQGSCSYNQAPSNFSYIVRDDLTCKVANGSEFCAVSDLDTVVQKRVQ